MMRWCYDDTYGCFIDSRYCIFIDTTYGFFIDKCYNWKRSHESRKMTRTWFSSIISTIFNDEGSEKRNHKSRNRIMEEDGKQFLVLLHPLSNIEIIKYFNHKLRFNEVCSRDNLARKMMEHKG